MALPIIFYKNAFYIPESGFQTYLFALHLLGKVQPKTFKIEPIRPSPSFSLGCAPTSTGLRGWKSVYLSTRNPENTGWGVENGCQYVLCTKHYNTEKTGWGVEYEC